MFFSSIVYADRIISASREIPMEQLSDLNITLVTGIANPAPLVQFLKSKGLFFEHLKYKDHHNFALSEIKILEQKSFVLTTEKDYMRLKNVLHIENLYYIPISITIDREGQFKSCIDQYLSL